MPWAVVQLRQEDRMQSSYNLVGFQYHLKFPDQKRVLRKIPGLENAEFLRLGQIHRNTYINAPQTLAATMATHREPRLFFAGQLAGDGFVIGLDNSVPMMERAVRDNSCDHAVYVRGDALDLPFNNRAFDVVSCFAALHLVPEPLGVLHEMVRVLSPGGRIAVMTTYGRESFLVRRGLELGATICGVRVFDRSTIPAFFAAAGLVGIDQQLRGISQFVVARRPERVTEFGAWRASTGTSIHRTDVSST